MKRTHSIARMAFAALLALLAAAPAFGVGTGGTGLRMYAHGALTLGGGVVVKGITFDPSNAAITINGHRVNSADDLLPGMVAGVDGDVVPGLQSGVAHTIHVTRVVLGAVTAVTPAGMTQVGTGGTGLARFNLVGVTVTPRADVVVAGCASLADIVSGTTLDVYGYSDGISGDIDATRIECVGPSASVELHGVASAITPTTMVVQGVTIDISNAQFVGFSAPIAAGDRVEVDGAATARGITATTVTFEPDAESSNGEDAEVEDAISAVISPLMFVVDSFEIDATNAKFSGGTAADLAVGRVVHVEGTIVNGVLDASSVGFDDDESDDGGGSTSPDDSEMDDVDGAISTFASTASFVVDGMTVDASAATFINGAVTDLAVGKEVKVTGIRTGKAMKAASVKFNSSGDGASGDHGSTHPKSGDGSGKRTTSPRKGHSSPGDD